MTNSDNRAAISKKWKIPSSAKVDPRAVFAGEGIVVQDATRLDAACVIGENVKIGQGAWVRAGAVVLRSVRLCCTNHLRDSLFESSGVAGGHEQLVPYEVQDEELAVVQHSAEAARFAIDLV
jgi:serine acetyltransferase